MKKLLAVGLLAVGLLWGVSAFAQISQTDSVNVLFDVVAYLMFEIDDLTDPVDLGDIQAPDAYSTGSVGTCDYEVITNVEWDLQLTSVSIITDASTHPTKDVTDIIETRHANGVGWTFLSAALPINYLMDQAADDADRDGQFEWRALILEADFNYFPAGNTYEVQCIVTCTDST